MKRLKCFYFLTILTLLSVSCFTGFFPENKETIDGIERPHTTKIHFNNTGIHRAIVFSDHNRMHKIGDATPNGLSASYDFSPSFLFDFYLTYYLSISGVEIPFIPPMSQGGVIQEPVRRDQDNSINIISLLNRPLLDPDTILINNVYYIAINNSSLESFRFMTGVFINNVVDGKEGDEVIEPGKTGIYMLAATQQPTPRVRVVLTDYPLSITSFERGKVYSFDFNGSFVTLNSITDITLSNSMH